MTVNSTPIFENQKSKSDKNNPRLNNCEANFPLIGKYELDVYNMPVVTGSDKSLGFKLPFLQKMLFVEKLLEAHELAKANVEAGNITRRGFATNVCTSEGLWAIGTNFNNTRNDISSVCGERTAILSAYNRALTEFSKNSDKDKKFVFKVKFLLMAQSVELSATENSAVPCEDCLSWFNTSRFFDDDTKIFSFEKNSSGILCLKVTFLKELLPYRNLILSNDFSDEKEIEFSALAKQYAAKDSLSKEEIRKIVKEAHKKYLNSQTSEVSGQKTACSIFANGKIYSAAKIDWTKRWFIEPLEIAAQSAIEENKDANIKAVCYFGDEFAGKNSEFNDGLISIKSLGRIRQKYASSSTFLILNLKESIFVTTIGEYLPHKFVQGYKIV